MSVRLGNTQPNGNYIESWFLEFFMTFILLAVILFIENNQIKNIFYIGGLVGLTIFFAAYFGGPIRGASLNPARSFGPAIISNNTDNLMLYLSAPSIGAFMAVYLCRKTSPNCCLYNCC